ncbi:hypothetical protein LAZ67_16000481 [Cordylochernes scorpioides]|uniref:Mos1 transposase HTH domain-containing protein n=1 Tax=Cordylochernes scorpioides TaxID=51811 RepID=A0ABY6LAN8_9ARAC|nr:hypothetical protein LAZ67_16000481 [Cordylochernes scorpioides]
MKTVELWRSKSWILRRDNVPAHTALKISKFLQDHSTSVFPQPPYSPELAPCDFFLFGKLKKKLKGQKFQSTEEIKVESKKAMKAIPKTDYQRCFADWKKRWLKCIAANGDYFEGDNLNLRNSTLRHLELFCEFLLHLGTVLIQQSLQFSVLELLGRFSMWFIIKFKIATLEFFKPPVTLRFAQSVVAVNFLEHSVGFSGTFLPVEGEQQNFPQMGTFWLGNRHFPRAPENFHDLNFSKTARMLMPHGASHLQISDLPLLVPSPDEKGGGGAVTSSLKNMGSAGPADSTLFLNAKNNSPVEIHRQLVEAYGEMCMDIKNVRKWCREFNEGRINVHDEQRSGRPSLPESTVAPIDEMVRANRRITLEEIEDGLNEDCSHFSVHKIVSETLGYRKVSARWVDKWLKEAAGEWYNTGITKLVDRMKKVIEHQGDYISDICKSPMIAFREKLQARNSTQPEGELDTLTRVSSGNTYELIKEAFGDAALSRSRTFEWFSRFLKGREKVNDDQHTGRPRSLRCEENKLKIKRISIKDLSSETGLSVGLCHRIVTKDLDMIRTSSKFVPRILTEEQKVVRMDVCKNMVEMTRTDPQWMQKIITGDETWVYQYDSETKRQSSQWIERGEPKPKKARFTKSNVKTLLVTFF